jgi:hypothetical protein
LDRRLTKVESQMELQAVVLERTPWHEGGLSQDDGRIPGGC